jgi:hypothetical protein
MLIIGFYLLRLMSVLFAPEQSVRFVPFALFSPSRVTKKKKAM